MENNSIGIVMGGYLDENGKLMDRTELNRRIYEIQHLNEQLKEQLKECEFVLNEISIYADCDDVNGEAGNLARQFLAKVKEED